MGALPDFIEPMLAQLGSPFDSEEHFFEVKWDGFRGLVFVDGDGLRLKSRRGVDLLPRFRELAFLEGLPDGLVLDGEIVILKDGKADFHQLLARERRRPGSPPPDPDASPALFMAFDLLYHDFTSVMSRPFSERRALLTTLVEAAGHEQLHLSQGVHGSGRAFFDDLCAQGLEGVVAKRLNSRYLPGRRSDAWTKFKNRVTVACVVIGYDTAETGEFKSLIVAAQMEGNLRCVGKVGSGFTDALRDQILAELSPHGIDAPALPVPFEGHWVAPVLYAEVSYAELTPAGMLRAPVLERWLGDR